LNRVADRLEQYLPFLDVLVNNAGITRDMTFKKMDKINWGTVMHANLDSCFNMTKQVCDGMIDRGWGRVINISSVNGQKGAFGQTNYSAAKAGMHGFTKALALEVVRKGVTVNTISPGYIGTRMVRAIPKEVLESKIIPQIPMGRLGEPEEVAGSLRIWQVKRPDLSPAPTLRSTAASTCSSGACRSSKLRCCFRK
jgi:acetoacetyl-CoA reductase